MSVQQENFTAIANKIREKTGQIELIKPNEFVNKIDDVYSAGKKSEYDTFWDEYQNNGERTDYTQAFARDGWTDTTFNPKYKITPTILYYTFANSKIADAYDIFREKLDTSQCTDVRGAFRNAKFSTLPSLNFCNVNTELRDVFYGNPDLYSIDEIKCPDLILSFTNAFVGCTKLKEIRFTGILGKTLDFRDCPLSVDSMKNIISHLLSYRMESDAFTQSLIFSSDCWALLNESDPIDGYESWQEYIHYAYAWNV